MPAENDLPSSSRALVVVASNPDRPRPAQASAQVSQPAIFLAQLIASARRVPQARTRRRADPTEVIAAYQDTIARIKRLNAQSQ